MDFYIRFINAAQTAKLRQKVLRPHQTLDEMKYPNDEVEGAKHLGAFMDDELIGIASIYPEDQRGNTEQIISWRLRGMATDPKSQNYGVGKALLSEALETVKGAGGQELWCNARITACDFYEKFGFDKLGDKFDIEGIGPHFIMLRSLRK